MMTHYHNLPIDNISVLYDLFPNGVADPLNWCIFSTSSVGGNYTTLDKAERRLKKGKEAKITVLVIKPRVVTLGYGHIKIEIDDIPFLRNLARTSLEQIARSQEGNL